MARREFLTKTSVAIGIVAASSVVRLSRVGGAPAADGRDCVPTYDEVIPHSVFGVSTPCVLSNGSPGYAELHDCNPACGPTLDVSDFYCANNSSQFPLPHSTTGCTNASGAKRWARRPDSCYPSAWPQADGWIWSPASGYDCATYFPCTGTRMFGCMDGWYDNGLGYYRSICRSYKCTG